MGITIYNKADVDDDVSGDMGRPTPHQIYLQKLYMYSYMF